MRIFTDDYGDLNLFGFALVFIATIAAIIGVIGTTIRQFDYHYTSTYCQDKLKEAGRKGKFVEYNFWEYDCLAESKNGTYIPLRNLYNNVQENSVE